MKRVAAYVVAVLFLVFALNESSRTINTLNALRTIQSERDQWQRPSDVIRAMKIGAGSTAADVGSGAGYFALNWRPALALPDACLRRTFNAGSWCFYGSERSWAVRATCMSGWGRRTTHTCPGTGWMRSSWPTHTTN